MTFRKIWFYTWFSAVFYLCEFREKIETQKLHNFWTVDRIEVIFFLKSLNFSREIRFCTWKWGKLNGNMRRHLSLILYHLLSRISYIQIMQFQIPLAKYLLSKNTRDPEKFSFNKKTVIKLRTKVCHVRKSVITSERLVYLKNATAINPWYCGNPAPF